MNGITGGKFVNCGKVACCMIIVSAIMYGKWFVSYKNEL
jgi:hypothetical protein